MHRAAYNNSLEAVKVLLAHGADVNARDDYSNTALHYAASYGHDALTQAPGRRGGHQRENQERCHSSGLRQGVWQARVEALLRQHGAE